MLLRARDGLFALVEPGPAQPAGGLPAVVQQIQHKTDPKKKGSQEISGGPSSPGSSLLLIRLQLQGEVLTDAGLGLQHLLVSLW